MARKPNNSPSIFYTPETADEFFANLLQVLEARPDYERAYKLLNRLFQRFLEQATAECPVLLGGTFAKTDYLLKEHKATREMVLHTNDTRVRLRHHNRRHQPQANTDVATPKSVQEELARLLLVDIRNIAEFIAFILNAHIPLALKCTFPTESHEATHSLLLRECMRMIVDRWDETYVYGPAEEGTDGKEVKVCYREGSKSYPYDWTYLARMFYSGAQLNIVHPRQQDDVIYPELIIFEPDYLVDISAIARCFTNYAESPYVNLVNKLQPSQITEAIALGNFAGQMLDEEIHTTAETRTYKESVQQFWHDNAMSILSATPSPSFHAEAMVQKENISRAIGSALPKTVSTFDAKECMVEPSFFSEMLGIQGRMDLLQLDFSLLLEQKSGKGAFPYDNFNIPRYKEEHYVQMLLYMMLIRYNFRSLYEHNGRRLSAFLLYSRYKESLLGLGFAPDLIFRAIKIRNGIAWSEHQFVKPGGFDLLTTLTPEKLNQKQVQNGLWTRYQQPQLATLLAPIQEASPLERCYYLRFLNFLANEHLLSKMGNKTKENSGFASKWFDTLDEKIQAGNIYNDLVLTLPSADWQGSVEHVTLTFPTTSTNDLSNFRIGDIVILYSYIPGEEPDVRRSMVFRCSIAEITTTRIELRLRAAQSDAHVFLRDKDKAWAVEHDFMESSYSSLYRGMHAFLSAPQERKDLLLFQREPRIDTSRHPNGHYGPFDTLAARIKQAQDLFLIIGPPGTGKTSYGMLNTLQEELTEPDACVLLLSYTNRAVDEICSKLHKEGIDFIRIGGDLNCSPEYHEKLLTTRVKDCATVDELRQVIENCRVFAATTTAMMSHQTIFEMKHFTLAIIDEASQILEPHLIGLLSAQHEGKPVIRKMVFIGDHKQLPAVVQQTPDISRVEDPGLQAISLRDCRLSLFERLLQRYRDNEHVVYMLTKQGRMHRDIADFPNQFFYNGRLDVVPCPHQEVVLPTVALGMDGLDALIATRRIAFIHATNPQETLADKVNQTEADIIAALVLRIYAHERNNFSPEETVGIIVPYRNQIATIRNTIDRSGIEVLHRITIDTVERYQGSQRRYIIYGFTIQKYYQLKFLTNNVFTDWDGSVVDRKLNVAMTRAEEHLYMVGNADLLVRNMTFRQLIDYVRSRNGYIDAPAQEILKGTFELPSSSQ